MSLCAGCSELPLSDVSGLRLRLAALEDGDALVAIRSTPEVHARWGGADLWAELVSDLASDALQLFVIEDADRIVGAIQWAEETDPMYRHAGIDIYLDPACHRRGIGSTAVRLLSNHLFDRHAHHRLVIDPAADNLAAIRCYEKVGFRRVGLMRRYERGRDGAWHDGLLMELLEDERPSAPRRD